MANDNVDVTLVATTNAAHLAADIEYASVPYGLPTLGRRPGRCGTRAVPPRRSDTRSLAAARPDSSAILSNRQGRAWDCRGPETCV
jgi:hypothetical protein